MTLKANRTTRSSAEHGDIHPVDPEDPAFPASHRQDEVLRNFRWVFQQISARILPKLHCVRTHFRSRFWAENQYIIDKKRVI